ncbi:MAG: EAL domain-containing protein, partial [Candidatus Obscuribacterales bacterium]|nr:EAL domain-containing protein [Candidatus Obscuribacterales bacterium]
NGSMMPFGTYKSDGKIKYNNEELPVHCALRGETVHNTEMVIRNRFKPEGIHLRINANPIRSSAGNVICAVVAFADISVEHDSEQRHSIFRQVFAQTQEAIVITDARFVVQYANNAYWELTGNSPDKILHRPFAPQLEEYQDGSSWPEMQETAKKDGRWTGEFVIRKRSNELVPLWATLHSVVDSENVTTNYVVTLSDLTNLKNSQEELYRMVSRDAVTGLSNRRAFFEDLEEIIERSERLENKFGLFFIDLQRFKELNDSLGHQAGDRVLQEVAARLAQIKKEDDAIARLGGDEFAIIVADCANDLDLALAIENIRRTIESPMTIAEHTITTNICLGAAVYPEDGQDAATLAKHCDIALTAATSQGLADTQLYTQRMNTNISRHFWVENNLRHSFGTNQLIPYFQPQLNLANGRPEEAEVLIRWNHPSSGLVNPGEFIPVAERTGLIGKVTAEVMDATCKLLVHWKALGMPLSCVAINISANLLLDQSFVAGLYQSIQQYALKPSDFLIEITESSAMIDPDQTAVVLKQMKSYGMSLAIDDFGTGYSSLAYLKKFAVDQIKIDQSFVKDLATSQESRSIVRAIVRMCEALGFETLAEGVETKEQALALKEFGCKKLQGYLIARPLDSAEYESFMRTYA